MSSGVRDALFCPGNSIRFFVSRYKSWVVLLLETYTYVKLILDSNKSWDSYSKSTIIFISHWFWRLIVFIKNDKDEICAKEQKKYCAKKTSIRPSKWSSRKRLYGQSVKKKYLSFKAQDQYVKACNSTI